MSSGSICPMCMFFQAMYSKGRYLYIAGDLTLQHSITSVNSDNDMAPERYRNFLAAESAYIDISRSPPEQAAGLVRLLWRTIRQRRYRNSVFSRMTFEFFWRRLLDSRAKRIQSWRKQSLQRDIPAMEERQEVG